ncbi:MAG: HigA family addiction module antidote protein [Bdellovibrionales bacterium]|nr:HigA family addiction module antidote protein [Bdellovibrionales bacterium]MBT3526060.1 HigA family addiction module antidote protein [Bdellovibrionales bacterium]MBT7669977.1 HigA family addiction module antidote protein [Bdellovibrionales bacterium]MBT7766719.1 HigA family addiction module antidote protein [Bdellovibrionales bacterium]
MKRTRRPTSPGEMLKEEFLLPLGLTQRQFADHIGVEVKAINRLVNDKTSITPLMALKLSSALGTTPEFWLNLQNANDLCEVENSKINLPNRIAV